jgi:hypothetical protein
MVDLVIISNPDTNVRVTNQDSHVLVKQPEVNVVTAGQQGPQGIQGPQGPVWAASFVSIDITAAGPNLVGNVYTLDATQLLNNIFEFTGSLTSNWIVVVPAIAKEYQVENLTTGAFTLTIKTPAGMGVTWGAAEKTSWGLYTNGINVEDKHTQKANDSGVVHLAGAETITGAKAFTLTITAPALKPSTDSTTAFQLQDATGNSILNVDSINRRVGVGLTLPTAVLHLKAGTAAAGTAPLKFATGTNLTTAEAGALEFSSLRLNFTPDTTRRRVNVSDDVTSPSAITVGASVFTYQNTTNYDAEVLVNGGTVSLIEFTRNNTTFYTVGSTTGFKMRLAPADRLRVTYSVIPTMTLIPM